MGPPAQVLALWMPLYRAPLHPNSQNLPQRCEFFTNCFRKHQEPRLLVLPISCDTTQEEAETAESQYLGISGCG